MLNLVKILWRFHFTLLFLVLQGIAIMLLTQGNPHHRGIFYNATQEVAGNVYTAVNDLTEYVDLKDQNKVLVEENARLKSLDRDAFRIVSGNMVEVDDTIFMQQYRYLGAKVIKSSVNRRNNYLILNRGRAHGLEPEMGVICQEGVVGKIRDVSENFATVYSVLHKSTSVPTRLKKNNFIGTLVWNGEDPALATLNAIPLQAGVEIGDTLVTHGSSAIYPEGVAVGTVESFEPKEATNFYTITVRLSTNFNNLSYCYVVRNLLKTEQLELEEQLINEEDE